MAWSLRSRHLPLVAAALVLLTLPLAAQALWQAYQHPESGYRIDIPTGVLSLRGESEGRLLFESADGRARLVTYSVDNRAANSVSEIAEDLAAADAIDRVTYRRQGRSWVVLSGYYKADAGEADSSIFYLKLMMSKDRSRYAVFAVSYPPDAKRAFDPIVTRLERSFRPPS